MRQHSQRSIKKQAGAKTKKQVTLLADAVKPDIGILVVDAVKPATDVSMDNMISDNGCVETDHEVPQPPVKKTSRRRRDDGAIFRTMKKEIVDPVLHLT